MKETDKLLRIIQEEQLGEALSMIEESPQLQTDETEEIKADYRLMLDYMKQGYADPDREKLYARLLQRLYNAVANRRIAEHIAEHPLMLATRNRVRNAGTNWSVRHIEQQLQAFVMDLAVAQLEQKSTDELYDQHLSFQIDLFDYILTSKIWSQSVASAFETMLLSPTIDRTDQLLIVSAISVSNIETYDPQKFALIQQVYRQTNDKTIRQRALVGWTLSLSRSQLLTPMTALRELLADNAVVQELTELQMQLVYCITARQDNRKIHDEIIPGLMKGNSLRINRSGNIEEREENPLDELLHPDEAERNMEEMERSMQQMTDMQQQGADVFFEGFSQMKRFAFFQQTANWFVPFYRQHPGIRHVMKDMGGNGFFEKVLMTNNFCDSDKYSFTLAVTQVWHRMPENIKNVLAQADIDLSKMPDFGTPAFIRRSYLQDIYRFYTLYQNKQLFSSPFDYPTNENQSGKRQSTKETATTECPKWLFLSNPIFRDTPMESHIISCAKFLYKKGLKREAQMLLANCTDKTKDYQYYMLSGTINQSNDDFEKALTLQPDDEHALRGSARSSFASGDYKKAAQRYERLVEKQPQKWSYQLNLAICLAHSEDFDRALPLLYKLDFEQEQNTQAKAALAWTLMQKRDYAKANQIYDSIQTADPFNAACCKWITGNVGQAVELFRQAENAQETIEQERDNLIRHGLTPLDISMMQDLIRS